MKLKITLAIMFAFIGLSYAQQNLPHIPKERPAYYEYLSEPDSFGNRTILRKEILSIERMKSNNMKLPYPIIFIHGLNSNSATWNTTTSFLISQYGLTCGGEFDYCLNYEGAPYSSANTNFWPTTGADIAVFTGTWSSGDFYYVNFDVASDGTIFPSTNYTYNVESNQAAVAKQGAALSDAIYRVLQLTGRDKVILIGHSMGGLASREYLQNPNLWQPDGQAHVAKLATTGTPHGGSNQVTGGVLLSGVDCQSEAYRDLRTTYSGSGDPGVYLFGGVESNTVMNLSFCSNFYNIDVNCNGFTGETITGLDQKNIYTDLDYSNIIGECSGCSGGQIPGDGIVLDVSANLNTYYPGLTTNLFYYNAFAILEIHRDLPGAIYQNMQGLDEPEYLNLAYHIGFDTSYTGFMTVPSAGDPNSPYDVDDYKFNVPSNSDVTVSVNNIIIALNFWVYILDSNYNYVDSAFHQSGSLQSIQFTSTLNAGDYYLQIYAIPDANSYLTPYNFILNNSLTGIKENNMTNKISIYPNPNNGSFTLSYHLSTIKNELQIKDVLGRTVYTYNLTGTDGKQNIDVSSLNNGVYFYSLKSGDNIETHKLIIEK